MIDFDTILATRSAFPGALSDVQIRDLVADKNSPLIRGYADLTRQVQPNGFDLTVSKISRINGVGRITVDNADRKLPDYEAIPWGDAAEIWLTPGSYAVTFNETVHLPIDVMAFSMQRSSLARSGVLIHTGIWDAGYNGSGAALLYVPMPNGIKIQQNAALIQLVFIALSQPSLRTYDGVYQGEGI